MRAQPQLKQWHMRYSHSNKGNGPTFSNYDCVHMHSGLSSGVTKDGRHHSRICAHLVICLILIWPYKFVYLQDLQIDLRGNDELHLPLDPYLLLDTKPDLKLVATIIYFEPGQNCRASKPLRGPNYKVRLGHVFLSSSNEVMVFFNIQARFKLQVETLQNLRVKISPAITLDKSENDLMELCVSNPEDAHYSQALTSFHAHPLPLLDAINLVSP